jgi:hypothetical protein
MKAHSRKFIFILVISILAVLSLTIVAVSAADIPWNWSSEPGTLPVQFTKIDPAVALVDEGGVGSPATPLEFVDLVPSTDGSLVSVNSSLHAAEPQPDEDGYTGAVPETLDREIAPSADSEPQVQIDWSSIMTEPQPDDNVAGYGLTDAGLEWSTLFSYYHSAGSALRPRDSSVNWTIDPSGGCIYLASGDAYTVLNIHLDVPHGSRIEYLRLFYYDTSASDSTAWVTRYNDEGGIEDVTNVTSDTNTGYGTTLSAYIEHVVDSTNYSYVLNWRPYVIGSTMQLCGLRVAYRLP